MAEQIKKGHGLGALIIGVLEIILALVIVICSFVLAGKADIPTTLTPYWAGVPFILPGILGVVSGITKNKCAMIAFMVLNIICFVLQCVGTLLVAIVVAIWAGYASGSTDYCTKVGTTCKCTNDSGEKRDFHGIDGDCNILETITVLLYVIVVFCVIGAIATLAASILGCASVCCSGGGNNTTVIVQQPGMVMTQSTNGGSSAPPNYYDNNKQ